MYSFITIVALLLFSFVSFQIHTYQSSVDLIEVKIEEVIFERFKHVLEIAHKKNELDDGTYEKTTYFRIYDVRFPNEKQVVEATPLYYQKDKREIDRQQFMKDKIRLTGPLNLYCTKNCPGLNCCLTLDEIRQNVEIDVLGPVLFAYKEFFKNWREVLSFGFVDIYFNEAVSPQKGQKV